MSSTPEPLGAAALTAQRRYEACGRAAIETLSRGLPAEAASQAAATAESGCEAARTELRAMLLFEYRLRDAPAALADRRVDATRIQLIDTLTKVLAAPR